MTFVIGTLLDIRGCILFEKRDEILIMSWRRCDAVEKR